ncbi:MAG: efflux RND transporter periplasmic adaptor subunit [Acidobacteriota bacterium]
MTQKVVGMGLVMEHVNVRRWFRRLVVVAILISLAVLLKVTVFAPEPVPVEVVVISAGRVEETVTNSRAGTVRARNRAKLSPEIGGMVVELPFREGERVKKGAVVLRLDDQVQRAQLELARREFSAATAQRDQACLEAELAVLALGRTSRLEEAEIASKELLDQVRTGAETSAAACEAARANVERARAALELAGTRLEKTVLRAPFDAVVAEVQAEVGEWVSPSPPALPIPPVIDILDPDSIYISAPMDEVDSARIAPGQPVRVSVDSYPGKHFLGHVSRVAPYVLDVEAQNRTVEIEVDLDDGAASWQLLPGTSADVEVILDERLNVLRVPTPALLEGNRVLRVDGDRLASSPVRTGLRNWDYTEVVEGLAEGEEVVVSLDRPEVQEGALVVVEEASGAP